MTRAVIDQAPGLAQAGLATIQRSRLNLKLSRLEFHESDAAALGFHGTWPETSDMKCLIVHETDKGFLGEEVEYKRSGSGFYRETSTLTIPQSREEIAKFAKENAYSVEWRNLKSAPATA